MTWQGKTVLAVVPARGGSKGIPRKNLRTVGGLSLIGHAARVVRELPWLDRALLSTDDEELAAEGRAHGLDVPFMRPARHATDDAAGASVWRHAWLAAEKHYGMRFDLSVYLQPTTPIRHAHEVEATLRVMVEGGYAAATTVSPVPGHFTPQKILTLESDGRLGFYLPEGQVVARQHAPRYWYRNGLCYAAVRAQVAGKGHIMEGSVAGVPIERPVVNIDEPVELLLAEALWREEHGGTAPTAKPKRAARPKPKAKAAAKPKSRPAAKAGKRKT